MRDRGAARARPGRQSLQGRILSRALLISVVPLLLISSVTLGSLLGLSRSAERNLETSRQELGRDVAERFVRASAVGVAREMEQLVAERVDDIISLAATPNLRRAARVAGDNLGDVLAVQPDDELEQQFDADRRLSPGGPIEQFVRATARRQPMIQELFLTDRNGLNVATSGRTSDFVQRDETWWNRAWDDGLYLGPVQLDESSDTAFGLTVAARVDSGNGEPLGVLRAVVDIARLQQIATRKADDTGTEVTLLAADGRLLAETRTDHSPERIANADLELDDEPAATLETALERGEPGFVLQDSSVAGYAPLSVADGSLATLLEPYSGVNTRPVQWVAVVDQSNDAAFAPLRGLADVQRGLSSTARTFVVIILITLIAALLAAFLVATRLAQRIVQPLRSLGTVARDIAERQLPALVRHAQRADGDAELPSVPAVQLRTNDEIEDVADAFNIVSNTAADLAAEQAKSRRNVARMFVSLGRRNQNLLSRQLEFIDRLERDTADPDLLEDLFRLDHLATRMRRNAESLLVLAGEDSPRRWAEPVSLADVVRAAVGEIEDYQRVNIDGVDEAALVGTAVSDVTHLLAELIENATQFSPPDSEVVIVGRRVVEGYALAVVDDGVGMSEDQLEDANRRLEMSPLVDRVPSSYLGLFVVGRLAARHGIRVRLVESTTEGVTTKVLLPTALVDPPQAPAPREIAGVQQRRALVASSSAGAQGELSGGRRGGGETSTAVIDAPASTSSAAASTGDDEAQPPGLGPPRGGLGLGRRTSRRGLQIDLRDPVGDGPSDDAPPAPATDRGDQSDAERKSPAEQGDAPVIDHAGAPSPPSPPGTDSGGSDSPETPAATDAQVPAEDASGAGSDVEAVEAVEADETDDTEQVTQRPAIEVRRRASKRSGTNGAPVDDRRAVLRTERSLSPAPPESDEAADRTETTATEVVDEDGVALTASEREARAARDRLALFQRAVQKGRAQTKSRNNGGELHDA